jgi:hypothetical protein
MRKHATAAVVGLGLLISGCSYKPMAVSTVSKGGTLYFSIPTGASGTGGEIFNLSDASAANGTVTPNAISGASTQLEFPGYVALAPTADRLFVNNGSTFSVEIFERASTRSGNTAPDRVISGSLTGFNTMGPMVVDEGRDLMYVVNGRNADGSFNILSFASASTVNGNAAPSRVLQVGSTGFAPVAMTLDQANDRLFVSSTGTEIDVYDGISSLPSGAATPNRIISGPHTGLSVNTGLALDGAGRLLVCNQFSGLGATPPTITIYANAATANGDVASVATIVGSNTGLNEPFAMAVNNKPGSNDSGDLYVTSSPGKVLVFTNIAAANGNLAPARTLTFPANFGSGNSLGIAIDTSR